MFRSAVVLGLVAAASAYAPTPALSGLRMQSADVDRRQILQAGVAGAIVTGATAANAQPIAGQKQASNKMAVQKAYRLKGENYAPIITILDHRGCESNVNHKEYRGKPSNDENDEMIVVIKNTKLQRDDPRFVDMADRVLSESLSELYGFKR